MLNSLFGYGGGAPPDEILSVPESLYNLPATSGSEVGIPVKSTLAAITTSPLKSTSCEYVLDQRCVDCPEETEPLLLGTIGV